MLGWGAVLAVLAFLIWGVPRAFRWGIDASVDALPVSIDRSIGEAVEGQLAVGGELVEDELLTSAVQEMLDRLTPFAELPGIEYHVRVVESEVANAFALPGGYLTVFTGLIAEAESPEQVAGVLAHEIAHVTERHGLRRIAHSLGLWVAIRFFLGDTQGLANVATELFTMASVNDYSQEQESGADAAGVRMMIAARIDPSGLAHFFEQMEERHGDVPPSLSWTSTHPRHVERVEAIQAQIARRGTNLPDFEGFSFDWEAVRDRAGR